MEAWSTDARSGSCSPDEASVEGAVQHVEWRDSGYILRERKGGSVVMHEVHLLDDNRTGLVVSINVSGGGVPKKRISGARVAPLGLLDDAHDDTKHHGGPDRAVCLYSIERIRALQAEGHPIDVGTAGENVTVEGLDWNQVVPGTRIRLGDEVLLEVTAFTTPCKTIRQSFIDESFIRISHKLYPGWSRVYARVLSEGEVHFGDVVELLAPPE
jgi:MOSC domain-containing protein YiiM